MRILYVTHLTEQNGATLALRNIIEGMVKRGVEVCLVAPSQKGYICDETKRLGGRSYLTILILGHLLRARLV